MVEVKALKLKRHIKLMCITYILHQMWMLATDQFKKYINKNTSLTLVMCNT